VAEEDTPTNFSKPGCDWMSPSTVSVIGYAISGTT